MTFTQRELLHVLHRMQRERMVRQRKVQETEWGVKKAQEQVRVAERAAADAKASLEAIHEDIPGVRAAILATGMDEQEMERNLRVLETLARDEEQKRAAQTAPAGAAQLAPSTSEGISAENAVAAGEAPKAKRAPEKAGRAAA